MFFKAFRLILGVGCLAAPLSAARFSTFHSGGPDGGEILTVAFKPGNSTVVLAGSENDGVFQSTDEGATWNSTNSNRYIEFCQAIVFDPANPTTAYAGGGNGGGGLNFERSTDSGKTWNFRGTTLASQVRSLVIDPVHTENLIAGTDSGIYRTTDAGATWIASSSGLPDAQFPSLSIDPATPTIAIAASRLGTIFRSTDSGSTWKPVTGLSATPNITDLAFDPAGSGRAFAGGDKFYRSTDDGATWQAISTSGFTYQTYSFAFRAPSTIFAASGEYLQESTDGGVSWSSLSSKFFLRDVSTTKVAIDPSNPLNLAVATYGSGVVRSTDGGNSWTPSSQGLIDNVSPRCVAVDSRNPSAVFAGSSLAGAWRTTDSGQTWSAIDSIYFSDAAAYAPLSPGRFLATGFDVSFSTNDGATWTTPSQNVSHEVDAIAVSPANADWIYAGTDGQGVWLSTNGGGSFSPVSTDLPMDDGQVDPSAIAGDFGSAEIAYVAVYNDSDQTEVYKTTDAGNHWASAGTGLPAGTVVSLTADPATQGIVYAGTDSGLFKTTDGGAHWIGTGNSTDGFTNGVDAVAIVSDNPQIVFAGTAGTGVFMSTDAGSNWTNISDGLPAPRFGLYINGLATDPTGSYIYAATVAGVFQITPAPLIAVNSPQPAPVGGRGGL